MEKLSIKIKIIDREYPMKVSMEEEERVRKAAKLINEKIKAYRDQFGIDEKQDLLAMVAFDSLVEKLRAEESTTQDDSKIIEKVDQLNSLITQAL